ncbi:MAG: DUF3883 domain-containing protein [Bacteroidetes bacterium]|nr:DUF3883 domain-containing protein [Bacteroidota bacterium]MCW5897077.1 DUF3883 domain-containing protein [Bacteroidota bacterium]
MPTVSPGRITAVWVILKVAARRSVKLKRDLLAVAGNTSLRGGTLPLLDGFELAILAGFLKTDADNVELTERGFAIQSSCNTDEPSQEIIRSILMTLILQLMPRWTWFVTRPLQERLSAVPADWLEVLRLADLIDQPLSESSSSWWRHLQLEIREIDRRLRNKIGRRGEEMTIQFEKERLDSQALPELSSNIKWKSLESDEFGYDVASFAGLSPFNADSPELDILIEVKSTSTKADQIFRLYLSRNEWEVALLNANRYFFFLWRGVDPNATAPHIDGPLIVPASIVCQHAPRDVTGSGQWTNCRIELDINGMVSEILRV